MPADEEDTWSLSKIPVAWLGNVLAALAFCTLMACVFQDGQRKKPLGVQHLSQSPGPGVTVAAPSDTRIDINNASRSEVESLPGIGETIAREIIARRPFETVQSLNDVPGIGPKRLAKLIPLIKVGTGRPATVEGTR